jgi:hypothetical protein
MKIELNNAVWLISFYPWSNEKTVTWKMAVIDNESTGVDFIRI